MGNSYLLRECMIASRLLSQKTTVLWILFTFLLDLDLLHVI